MYVIIAQIAYYIFISVVWFFGILPFTATCGNSCIVCPPEAWDSMMSALAVFLYSSISLHETLVVGSQ